ncbi:MAG: HlyD family type I secretion periplasmic adaptor subunit [Desulfovibrionaceae bacterium]|nr:HlyD family type I secretion periplasmic adaptor subunit [Desulfovibrionaceae bacterium]
MSSLWSWIRGTQEKSTKIKGEILRFQPDSVLLERATPPLGARICLYGISIGLLILILWSIFGHIDRVVVGEGKIVTMTQPIILQTYSISLVKDIKVHMGQKVKKGDVLVVMDPTFAQADVDQLKDRIASLTAHLERLECELASSDYPPSPRDRYAQSSAELREQRSQADIFRSRREEYRAKLKSYDESRKKLAAEIQATSEDLMRRDSRLKIYREFEKMRENLYQRDVESRSAFLEIKRDRLAVESDVIRLRSSVQELKCELAEVEADRTAYVTGWRSEAAQELVTVRRDLDQASEQFNKAKKMGDLVNIRAPVDGVVLELAKRNAGSVADEAETLVTLVPSDAELEVEVEIQPQDIGYVQPGQKAKIKLATLPFQKHGKIDATLIAVSSDAFDKNPNIPGASVYKARLALPINPLENLKEVPDTFSLMPGMTATAEINVGDRRIIEYFLYPVLAGFDTYRKSPSELENDKTKE